jgi:hypothetical protein
MTVVQYALAAAVLLLVAYLARGALLARRRAPALERTRGTVLEKRHVGQTSTGQGRTRAVYLMAVRFRTQQGTEVSGTARGTYRVGTVREAGEDVDVWYDRGDPHWFQLLPPASLRASLPGLAVLALVAAVALAVVLL